MKERKFTWGGEQQEAFDQLLNKVTAPPILKLYNPLTSTKLHIDASRHKLAGMILQKYELGRWDLVICVSKRTTDTEKNYHAGKLELMAIVWSMERLCPFLLGVPFALVTDCQAIAYKNVHKIDPQIARWLDLLLEYDFEVKHRSGKKMARVDYYLNCEAIRAPKDTLNEVVDTRIEVCLTMTLEQQVVIIQCSDTDFAKLAQVLEKSFKERTQEESAKVENLRLRDRKLFYEEHDGQLLFAMPKSMRKTLCVKFHDLQGHFATDRLMTKSSNVNGFLR